MKKYALTLSQVALTLWLSAASLWPARARAADQPTAPAPAAAEQLSAQGPQPERKVPEQFSTMFKIDDDDPESTVPKPSERIKNPLEFGYYVQDLLTRAEVETKRKNYVGVIKYYRAVAAALPEEARGWGLLCEAYEKVQDRERAARACKYAIERKGAQLNDYSRYVTLVTAKQEDLRPEEREDLKAVLQHLDKQPDLVGPTAAMRCQVAVKTNDAAALEACTAVLAKLAPNDRKTIVFQWSLAVMRGDRGQAAALLARAQEAGVAPDSIDRMSHVAMGGHWWSTRSRGVIGVMIVGAAAALLALFLMYRRRLGASSRDLAQ